MKLYECLKIEKGITAVIGGGGKTSLIGVLARELGAMGKVIVTTSTKIWPPSDMPYLLDPTGEEIVSAFEKTGVLCVGSPHETGKLTACGISMQHLRDLCDYLLVEADGSAGLPLKGHGENEPQIPQGSGQCVLVLGIWGIGEKIAQAAHRPAIYARLAQAREDETVTAEMAAKVIRRENFHTRVFINGVEDAEKEKIACRLGACLDCPTVIGSLKKGEYRCLF